MSTRPCPPPASAGRPRVGPLPRVYPLPRPAADDRFTYGLLIDVLDVLETHGYPRPTAGADLVELQQALFGFLYDTSDWGRPDEHS